MTVRDKQAFELKKKKQTNKRNSSEDLISLRLRKHVIEKKTLLLQRNRNTKFGVNFRNQIQTYKKSGLKHKIEFKFLF